MRPRILVVDDEKMVRWGLTQALEQAGYQVAEAANAKEAVEAVTREVPDVVLLDYKLPDRDGLEVLRDVHLIAPLLPVIMITVHASISGAVRAMKEGVYDYIGKPFEFDDVLQTVERALETLRLRETVARQREEDLRKSGLQNFIAESSKMKEVLRMVERVAVSEANTILLLGESGVGKGIIARAMHHRSAASEMPFMHITCTALTEPLLESEIFGHEKGAFTDAKAQKKGLFELAEGGTVFLDEIGDLSASMQGKLLRFLEDHSFRRVGGVRDIQVNVRVIAATNKKLAKEVEEGRFRDDLYFRLKVIPIEIPPLRERVGDIQPLAEYFVRHFNTEFRKSIAGIAPSTMELMKDYRWPGNVRELRNAIERAVLLTEHAQLEASDLPSEIHHPEGNSRPPTENFRVPRSGLVLDDLEKDLVVQALRMARGNRTRAAKLLGLNRDQIRYRIDKYALEERADTEKSKWDHPDEPTHRV